MCRVDPGDSVALSHCCHFMETLSELLSCRCMTAGLLTWAAAARRTEDDPRDFIPPRFPLIFSEYFRFETAAQADFSVARGHLTFKYLFPQQIFSVAPPLLHHPPYCVHTLWNGSCVWDVSIAS